MISQIVNLQGLAELLASSPHTLRKNWRSYPHFFVGDGRTLRGARFDFDDVLRFLKKRDRAYVCLENKKQKNMDRKIQISGQAVQKRGISNAFKSNGLGSPKKGRVAGAEEDPFDLLSGCK